MGEKNKPCNASMLREYLPETIKCRSLALKEHPAPGSLLPSTPPPPTTHTRTHTSPLRLIYPLAKLQSLQFTSALKRMVYKAEVKAPDRRRRLAWGGDVNSECSRGIIWRETDGRLARTCRLSQIQTPKELRAFKRFNSRGDREIN